jgi:hypothetical protein
MIRPITRNQRSYAIPGRNNKHLKGASLSKCRRSKSLVGLFGR